MNTDPDRRQSIRSALAQANLEGLACALPPNVLLLSGYWPVVGTSVALATRDGRVGLVVPEDERELAERGCADEVVPFRPGSLDSLAPAADALAGALARLAASLGLRDGPLGLEWGEALVPAPYSAVHLYGRALQDVVGRALSRAGPVAADDLLARLRSVMTLRELERVRGACAVAGRAFAEGASRLRPGLTETEAAALFRAPLSVHGVSESGFARADGFAWAMSGPNAALAGAAYARSRGRRLERGDLVLVHCNSYGDGYWTDITRTFCLGEPDARQRELFDAVFAARRAALDAVRPGARAADVDAAARRALTARGLGDHFTHGTGHGVGFAAIDHNARPRLHPRSDDVLAAGMVFNVEPAVYFRGWGGIRHCDVVAVRPDGPELLTPFQTRVEDLIIR